MEELRGKSAVVTGASRGLGIYIAQSLAAQGVNVVLAARDTSCLTAAGDSVRSEGVQVVCVPADVSEDDARRDLVLDAEARLGRIDILVNNAAIVDFSRFHEQGADIVTATIETNLTAPMLLTQLVLPGMLERESGHIVNIVSLTAKRGIPYTAAYSASKAGLLQWGNALRLELAGTGVGVTAVLPSFITKVGMSADHGVPAPLLSGPVPPERVAAAVVRGIRSNRAEIIVRRGPSRPLYALAELWPSAGDALLRMSGAVNLHRSVTEQRRRDDAS